MDDGTRQNIEVSSHELKVLRMMCGLCAGRWGAAVGQALECLEGKGLITQHLGQYQLTKLGEAFCEESFGG